MVEILTANVADPVHAPAQGPISREPAASSHPARAPGQRDADRPDAEQVDDDDDEIDTGMPSEAFQSLCSSSLRAPLRGRSRAAIHFFAMVIMFDIEVDEAAQDGRNGPMTADLKPNVEGRIETPPEAFFNARAWTVFRTRRRGYRPPGRRRPR